MLVSCIMPTADRPQYVERAIGLFLEQTWQEKELLIFDSGDPFVKALVPDDARIKYWESGWDRVGVKRNWLCSKSQGEVIMHWDDDDLYAPWRITYQVNELLASDSHVSGTDAPIFHRESDGACFQYKWPIPGCGWVHGATLAYWRSHWELNPFPDLAKMEDVGFLYKTASTGYPAKPTEHSNWYVGTIHDSNTGTKLVDGVGWTKLNALPDWVDEAR